jgi:chorismate--pyruvate lyase
VDSALSFSFLHSQTPVWHRPSHLKQKLSAIELAWLVDKGSLTQKLIQKSQGDFYVGVIQQRIQNVPLTERRALNIPEGHWAVIREVILYGQQTPWVYARTIIPLTTLQGSLRRLHYLGNKPLGEQLFSDPSMRREPMEIALLTPQQLPHTLAISSPVWGRRSVFRLSNKPLLVSEVFLPAIFQ